MLKKFTTGMRRETEILYQMYGKAICAIAYKYLRDNELAKDRKSGEEKGGLTLEAVEKELGIINDWAFIRRSPERSFSVREQSKNFF